VADDEPTDQPVDEDNVPQTLVGISFPDIYRAQEFLTAATGLAAKDQLRLKDAVLVVKEADGRTHVKETIDPEPTRAALSGALWASLFGFILGGPVGWAAGLAVGGVGGAVTAKVVDLGVSDEWVDWFRQAVQPETATVVLLIEDLQRDSLVAEAARFTGAELVYANLEEDTLDRIRDALQGVVATEAVATEADTASPSNS
jgi:uncharacterized membrane protein